MFMEERDTIIPTIDEPSRRPNNEFKTQSAFVTEYEFEFGVHENGEFNMQDLGTFRL